MMLRVTSLDNHYYLVCSYCYLVRPPGPILGSGPSESGSSSWPFTGKLPVGNFKLNRDCVVAPFKFFRYVRA
jgi:hypothetical protein